MSVNITFLGGADTVTGSKYLVRHGEQQVLVDCGLFQGYKQLRLRNWNPPPFKASEIDAVLLTHAHLDHSGYLPLLCRKASKGECMRRRVRATCARSCCLTVVTFKKKTRRLRTVTAFPNTAQPNRFTPNWMR